ncbi:phage integrase N-terminal SAM-like domain-containing protein [Spongorhabdus nitratireducens]
MRHPKAMGGEEISQFLSFLAVKLQVAVNTLQQASSAIAFLYKKVLGKDDLVINDWLNTRRPKRLPVMLSAREVELILTHLNGTPLLITILMYGAGLRLIEALSLRGRMLIFIAGKLWFETAKEAKTDVHCFRINQLRVCVPA